MPLKVKQGMYMYNLTPAKCMPEYTISENGLISPFLPSAAHQGPVYSVTSAAAVLASGGSDNIKLWRWEELIAPSKDPQSTKVLTPPQG